MRYAANECERYSLARGARAKSPRLSPRCVYANGCARCFEDRTNHSDFPQPSCQRLSNLATSAVLN